MLLDRWHAAERRCPNTACFDEHGASRAAQDPQEDEDGKFEESPVGQISHLEQHNLASAVRVEESQRQRGGYTAEEGAEQRLWWEVIAHFLQTEQDATNRGAERNGHSGGSRCRQDFSTFAVILPILAEHAAGDVAHACSDVNVWAFFANRQSGGHAECETETFEHKCLRLTRIVEDAFSL